MTKQIESWDDVDRLLALERELTETEITDALDFLEIIIFDLACIRKQVDRALAAVEQISPLDFPAIKDQVEQDRRESLRQRAAGSAQWASATARLNILAAGNAEPPNHRNL